MPNGINPDTTILVSRTVVVSTEMTVTDLAEMVNTPPEQLAKAISTRAKATDWINENHLAEMVPRFDYTSTADGDVLDVDNWSLRTVR